LLRVERTQIQHRAPESSEEVWQREEKPITNPLFSIFIGFRPRAFSFLAIFDRLVESCGRPSSFGFRISGFGFAMMPLYMSHHIWYS
jgi:hypothetical protein